MRAFFLESNLVYSRVRVVCFENKISMNLFSASRNKFSRCLHQSNHVIEDGEDSGDLDFFVLV